MHFALTTTPGKLDALVERLRTRGVGFDGPVAHPGGDRSIYVADPAGNMVEFWDFFEHGAGVEAGVDALA